MADWEPSLWSPQSLYAKNLWQPFGYPLRSPEPRLGLPSSYTEDGLQIGDVGYVDSDGVFEVLFNICFAADHELHQGKSLDGLVGLTTFNPNGTSPTPDAFPSGRAICHGLQGPQGNNLRNAQSQEKVFYRLAEEYALKWCQKTDRRSLYLITGFYKSTSWLLGSFDNVRPTGQSLLQRSDTGYTWHSGCDYRESRDNHHNENQTVLILGFKIEVRDWDNRAIVQKLPIRSQSRWPEFRNMLSSFWAGQRAFGSSGVDVEHFPARESQLFHPSNAINRYLLDKNPNARVAITHDTLWLSMLKNNELLHEDMADEERFRIFLDEKYTNGSDSEDVVYLQKKIDDMSRPALPSKMPYFPTIPDSTQKSAMTPIDVLFVGQMGIGKSTIINMIRGVMDTDSGAAEVSNGALPCTTETVFYTVTLEDSEYRLWDMQGFDEAVESDGGWMIKKIYQRITQQQSQLEKELRDRTTGPTTPILMWCIHAGKVHKSTQYKQFQQAYVEYCNRNAIPAIVLTQMSPGYDTKWRESCSKQLAKLKLGGKRSNNIVDVPIQRVRRYKNTHSAEYYEDVQALRNFIHGLSKNINQ